MRARSAPRCGRSLARARDHVPAEALSERVEPPLRDPAPEARDERDPREIAREELPDVHCLDAEAGVLEEAPDLAPRVDVHEWQRVARRPLDLGEALLEAPSEEAEPEDVVEQPERQPIEDRSLVV